MVRICWERSTGCFIYNFVIQVISKKGLCSKGFTSNLIWKRYIHENNRIYNSYRFSYKFAFIQFMSFQTKPKTRIWFLASCSSANEKYFCFLVIASRALSCAEFNRLLQRNSRTCYFCSYNSSTEIWANSSHTVLKQ